MYLQFTNVFYGSPRPYPVKPIGMPQTFDFDNAERCARQAVAAIGKATGFPVRNAKVVYHVGRQCASIVGQGVHAYFAPAARSHKPMTAAEALAVFDEQVTIAL